MWDYVDYKVLKSAQTSKDKMWKQVQDAWNDIPKKVLKNSIFSMRKRCEAVIATKGGHTCYREKKLIRK